MAAILVYSEKDQLALELLTAARTMAGALGAEPQAVTINNSNQAQLLAGTGVKVFNINNDSISLVDVAAVSAALAQAAQKVGADTILLASNRRGKELAGRLAQQVKAGCLTDVASIKIDGSNVLCSRNALGGATVAEQYVDGAKKVLAVAPKSFEPAAAGENGLVEDLAVEVKPSGIKVLEVKSKAGDAVDIEAANIIVAVGQGLRSQADLGPVEDLAKALGGEVACSKPVATDKKWLSEERVIGLSGKHCKPELAILLGISGQVQFTVGIRDAKTIVSINSDENASMNTMADYILVADLHDAVSALNQALK